MAPHCGSCGQETVFIPQYQQWYCPRCNTYPFMPQAPAAHYPHYYHYPQPYYGQPYYPPQYYNQPYYAQPQYQQRAQYAPPVVGNMVQAAKCKIQASIGMRQGTDRQVSAAWAWVIVLFQVVLPASAVLAIFSILAVTESDTEAGFLLLAIVVVLLIEIGLAVVMAVLVHKLVARRDGHFRRDQLLFDGMGEYLGAASQATNIDLNVERWTINTLVLSNPPADRSAGLWAILVALIVIIPIVGIIFLIYCLVFLTKDVHQHDERQRAINMQFEAGLLRSGKISAVSDAWQPLPRRDVSLYVILTVLTLGMFLPYWWHANIEDMNTHMKSQWEFENALAERLKAEA